MLTSTQSVVLRRASAQPCLPPLTAVGPNALMAKQFGQLRAPQGKQPRPQPLVDCGTRHTLRQSGAQVWLRNVGPNLRQCFNTLQIN